MKKFFIVILAVICCFVSAEAHGGAFLKNDCYHISDNKVFFEKAGNRFHWSEYRYCFKTKEEAFKRIEEIKKEKSN